MTDPARAAEILGHLGALGVGVSIDDFGTGYSSLAYLRKLPVSEIKIDKSFVIGMSGNGGPDRAIVRSTSELGHNLGLRVVAEDGGREGVRDPALLRVRPGPGLLHRPAHGRRCSCRVAGGIALATDRLLIGRDRPPRVTVEV